MAHVLVWIVCISIQIYIHAATVFFSRITKTLSLDYLHVL